MRPYYPHAKRISPYELRRCPEGHFMTIRTYHNDDERAVIMLWNESLPDEAPHNDPATSIRLKCATDRNLFFVAELDGDIAGTVMGGYDGHRGWVYSLAVKPEWRCRGIATALIQRVENELVGRGCMKVNLQVRSTNKDVIEFYTKRGYKLEERVSMGKRLYEDYTPDIE